MVEQVHIDINEILISDDSTGYPIVASKITFFNRGNIPVFIGEIPLVPGASYQVNYEHPHLLTHKFKFRFDTSATPVNATYRALYNLENTPRLVIQTMTPKQ